MVDRQARDRMIQVIEAFLNLETSLIEFEERISRTERRTKDDLIRHTLCTIDHFFEEAEERADRLSKAQWDHCQRLLLLLHSDAEYVVARSWRWSWTQILAAMGLLGFLFVGWRFGWGEPVLLRSIPFGVLVFMIWAAREAKVEAIAEPKPANWERLEPFESVAQMLRIRRRVPGFRKQRFQPPPVPDAPRSILPARLERWLDAAMGLFAMAPFGCVACTFSPLMLCYQAFPIREKAVRIRVPE
jgi:hypothetical protein